MTVKIDIFIRIKLYMYCSNTNFYNGFSWKCFTTAFGGQSLEIVTVSG